MDIECKRGVADALRACLPFLWTGRSTFAYPGTYRHICYALQATNHPYKGEAQKVVMKRLWPALGMRVWLSQHMGIPESELTVENVQTHRIAWVHKLIEEFDQPEET